MPLPRLALTDRPLSMQALTETVLADAAEPVGGVAAFVGVVRGQNLGHQVDHLEYEAYEPLALRSFARIEGEVLEGWAGVTLGVHHRTGRLGVGEVSVVVVAASAHRGQAFAACRYAIERLKQIAPIWKHEHFEGGRVWIEGATADPDDRAAREEALRRACV